MKNKITLLSLLILMVFAATAQNLRKANYLFDTRAYVDAAELYLEEAPKTAEICEKLADSYYFNSNMKEAAKWYKALITNFPDEYHVINLYKYAQALKGIEDFEAADQWMLKYQERIGEAPYSLPKTKPFFKQLNAAIDRPYIVSSALDNGENSDFSPAYYGDKIVFTSTRLKGELYDWNKQPYADLYQADVTETGDLSGVTIFSEALQTADMHESHAVFTADGKTVFFTRNNNMDGKKMRDQKKISHLKIYRAELIEGQWTQITELPFNGDDFSTEHPALSADGKTMIFASDRPGGFGSFDLYKVTLLNDGTFSTPENLGEEINTKHREQFPYLSSTNNLYFSSDGHFGLGGLDIFKSEAVYSSFKAPVNLSDKINSPLDDFGFIIDEEAETGYFSSNREGKGFDAIYKFEQLKRYYVEGVVRDITDHQIIEGAQVTLKNAHGVVIAQTIVGADGFYSVEIEKSKEYSINGAMQFYKDTTIDFQTDAEGKINKDILLSLLSFEAAEEAIVKEHGKIQVKIKNIYFDFNKYNLKEASKEELNKVVEILKKYPTMKMEVGAHTDARGNDDYNMKLSHLRAKATLDYLIEQGIESERLTSVGYGESQPVNQCVREGICTDQEYDINRRCEFVILR